jgi:hypothetical protein
MTGMTGSAIKSRVEVKTSNCRDRQDSDTGGNAPFAS